MTKSPCFKCNGSGKIGAFTHVAAGVCFQCNGTGTLSSKGNGATFTPAHPIIPEVIRSTVKQWDYLARLAQDNDSKCRQWILKAGAPCASQIYVSKAVMSRAIEIAKGAEA